MTAGAPAPKGAASAGAKPTVPHDMGNAAPKQVDPVKALPAECGSIQLAANQSVVICKPTSESMTDKFLVAAPSVGMSMVALLLSGWALLYNVRKDSLLRDLSVKDDYWLRKIVSPASIEPFVLLSSLIIAELPDAQPDAEAGVNVKDWYDLHHTSLIRLKPGFKTLELLDDGLHLKVEEMLQDFEDELATYMGSVRLHQNSGSQAPVRAATVAKLSGIRVALLRLIQVHQTSLGKKVTKKRFWSEKP